MKTETKQEVKYMIDEKHGIVQQIQTHKIINLRPDQATYLLSLLETTLQDKHQEADELSIIIEIRKKLLGRR